MKLVDRSKTILKYAPVVEREVFDITSAAEFLGVSMRSVRNLINSGTIRHRRLEGGRKILITKRALLDWCEGK